MTERDQARERGLLVEAFTTFAAGHLPPTTFVEHDQAHNTRAARSMAEVWRDKKGIGRHIGHVVAASVDGRDIPAGRSARQRFRMWYMRHNSPRIQGWRDELAALPGIGNDVAAVAKARQEETERRLEELHRDHPVGNRTNLVIRKIDGRYVEVVHFLHRTRNSGGLPDYAPFFITAVEGTVEVTRPPAHLTVNREGLGVSPESAILDSGFPYVDDYTVGHAAPGRHYHVEPVILGQIAAAGLEEEFEVFRRGWEFGLSARFTG